MIVNANFCSMILASETMRETAFELERIRKDAEQAMETLMQEWQGDDSRAIHETFVDSGGLNEFSKRMVQGYLTFSDHLTNACNTYAAVCNSIANSEMTASRK